MSADRTELPRRCATTSPPTRSARWPATRRPRSSATSTAASTAATRLRWLSPAVDVLPAAVEQRTPPPSLRENLMATVRAEAAPSARRRREPRRERRRASRGGPGCAG